MLNHIKSIAAVSCIAATSTAFTTTPSHAGNDPFIGEIITVGFNFCPRGWAALNGQLLAISSNSALFSLLGTMYGGDGRTTFALPDMRSRTAIHAGQGKGLDSYKVGQVAGSETTAITMPEHKHDTVVRPMANTGIASRTSPVGAFHGRTREEKIYILDEDNIVEMSPDSIQVTESLRGNTSDIENNIQPVLVLNHCIALQGTFPSRN